MTTTTTDLTATENASAGRGQHSHEVPTGPGMDVEQLGGEDPHGCDLDTPDGLVLIGVDADLTIDEEWLSGATVLWDSATSRVPS